MVLNKKIKTILIALTTSVVVAVIALYRFDIYYWFLSLTRKKTNDSDNEEKLKGLHPIFAVKASRFVKELEQNGYDVIITSGFRTPEQQANLNNPVANPAQPLNSYHNYGFAIDMNANGIYSGSSKSAWQPIVDIAKKYGFRWGGDFNSNYDPVHFDYGNNYTIDELKALYMDGETTKKGFVKTF